MPDGQGQITNVDLGSADRIEVLRGPFSALYGNSSGGVIQVFTEDGSGPPTRRRRRLRRQLRRAALRRSRRAAASGGFGYVVSGSNFHTDGYRDHSAAERNIGNAKLDLARRRQPRDARRQQRRPAEGAGPARPDARAVRGRSARRRSGGARSSTRARRSTRRRSASSTSAGSTPPTRCARWSTAATATPSSSRRSRSAPQASPLHPGGVIELGRDYGGTDLRWTAKTRLADAPVTLVAGVAYDALDEHRRGYQNFIGTTLGVEGALRRDEDNDVYNFDQYLQGSWQFAPRWTLHAGVRHSKRALRVRGPLHRRHQPRRQRQLRLRRDAAGGRPDVRGDAGAAPLRHRRPRLRDADAERARLPAERPDRPELRPRPGQQRQLRGRREDAQRLGRRQRRAVRDAHRATRSSRSPTSAAARPTRTSARRGGAGSRRRGARDLRENLRAQVAYTWLDARYRDTFRPAR